MSGTAALVRHRFWRTVLRLNGGLDVRGALPRGGCVVVANHASHADTPSLLAALDPAHRPLVAAAADYWFDRPVKAALCRSLAGGFPVRRDGGGYADLAAQSPALAGGRAVIVFPAGSRHSADGHFHQGAFRLAQQCGVPVVPVRLSGTDRTSRGADRPRRMHVQVDVGTPLIVSDPQADARRTEALLAAPVPVPGPPTAGLRARVARFAASPAAVLLAFAWAFAEATIWPVLTELLIAALLLSGPRRPGWVAVRLALAATVGSAVGGVVTMLLARHGVLLPQPLVTPAMRASVQSHLAHGLSGLWSQPLSGVPYKAYARVAGHNRADAGEWFVTSMQVRCVRLVAVALLAVFVRRLTRRWEHLYGRAMAAGLLTFVVGLCFVAASWSATSR